MGYTERFRTAQKPPCYGKLYDDEDPECLNECPYRQSCFRKCSEEEETPAVSYGRRRTSSKKKALVPEIVYPDDVLPYEGEVWYQRLFWNSMSGALSAVGLETHVFFKRFRFPPKNLLKAPTEGGCRRLGSCDSED